MKVTSAKNEERFDLSPRKGAQSGRRQNAEDNEVTGHWGGRDWLRCGERVQNRWGMIAKAAPTCRSVSLRSYTILCPQGLNVPLLLENHASYRMTTYPWIPSRKVNRKRKTHQKKKKRLERVRRVSPAAERV